MGLFKLFVYKIKIMIFIKNGGQNNVRFRNALFRRRGGNKGYFKDITAREQIGDLSQTGVSGDDAAEQIAGLSNDIASLTTGRVMRYAVSVDPNHSAYITLSTDYSIDAEFALAAFNIGGNSLTGFELFALGRGTSKIKALIGAMDSQYYTTTYNTNTGTWVITNNATSTIKLTVMLTKGSVSVV